MAASPTSAEAPITGKWAHLAPNPRPALTDAQRKVYTEFVDELSAKHKDDPTAQSFLTPNTYSRYLWGHSFKPEKARENLEATLAWRKSYITPSLHCVACEKDPRNHNFVRVGVDRFRRPIVYFCPTRCLDSDPASTQSHTVSEMEVCFAAQGLADNWVFIMDMRGFGVFGGYSKAAIKEIISVFTAHYPERLGAMLLVDMPTVAEFLYSAVKVFMDPVTVRKVNMVKAKDMPDIAVALCGAGSPTAEWLVDAVRMDNKPGALPPLPASAPVPVHVQVAKGMTLPEVIAAAAAGPGSSTASAGAAATAVAAAGAGSAGGAAATAAPTAGGL